MRNKQCRKKSQQTGKVDMQTQPRRCRQKHKNLMVRPHTLTATGAPLKVPRLTSPFAPLPSTPSGLQSTTRQSQGTTFSGAWSEGYTRNHDKHNEIIEFESMWARTAALRTFGFSRGKWREHGPGSGTNNSSKCDSEVIPRLPAHRERPARAVPRHQGTCRSPGFQGWPGQQSQP